MGGASLRIKSSDGMYGIDDHLAIDRPSDIQTIRSIDFHDAFSKTNNWVSLHSDIIIGVNPGSGLGDTNPQIVGWGFGTFGCSCPWGRGGIVNRNMR